MSSSYPGHCPFGYPEAKGEKLLLHLCIFLPVHLWTAKKPLFKADKGRP